MSLEQTETKLKPVYGLKYFIWLMSSWTIYVLFIYPPVKDLDIFPSPAIGETFRILIFAVPILIFSYKHIPKPFDKFGITSNLKKGLLVGLIVAIVWFSFSASLAYLVQNKTFDLANITLAFLLTAFSISTIVEELAFRSFLLQSLESINASFAIIASSIAFVLIHYPGWIFFNMMPGAAMFISASVSIFLLGCILGIVFMRTRSIWAVVIIHGFNNLSATVLAGGS